MSGRVYNQPIRVAVERWIAEGNTWAELARKMGWVRPSGKPDSIRAKRSLGITEMYSYRKGEQYTYHARTLDEGNALRMIEAIDRAPNEFDL